MSGAVSQVISPGIQPRRLPEGWRRARLGELCRLVNGDAYKESDWSQEGVPIIRIQNLNDDSKPFNCWSGELDDRVVVKPGNVLLAWSGTPGTSFGVHTWKRGLAVLNQHIFRVDLHCGEISPDWAVIAINHQLDVLIGKAHGGVGLRHVTKREVESLEISLPPPGEQSRIAAILNEQIAAVVRARAAAEAQLEAAKALPAAYIRESFIGSLTKQTLLGEALEEVRKGVGSSWEQYPVLGATRNGLAPAKEPVGKKPEKYKLVNEGTIFYNPMRILLGSIAMVDDGDVVGVTSPDYVVFRTISGVLHARWFYHWLRSPEGDGFIKTLTRGAVRERMLFRRLAQASVSLPPWDAQLKAGEHMQQVRPIRRKLVEELDTINKLPAALLRRAFAGEL